MRKPPTIHDVAEALGMHKSTVSLALSGKGTISAATRDRVRNVASQLGYEPSAVAQRLAHGLRNTSVCLFSGVLDVGLATEKILLIQQELSARAFEVPIYTCPELTDKAQAAQIKQVCRQRPQAILCATQSVSPEVFRELETYQRAGGTVVSYDTPVPLECDQVIFDRENNAYQVARHLLEQGHRKIGIGMSKTPEWLWGAPNVPRTHRLQGFRRALEEFGVPVRKEWLFENAPYEPGGTEMACRFLQLAERPTGMCIVNDYMAFAFMVDVMRAGVRVPRDVSIVSHDNQAITSRCPVPMTSASQPTKQIAQSVVAMLIERLNGYDGAPRTVTLRGELVSRESVAPPPD